MTNLEKNLNVKSKDFFVIKYYQESLENPFIQPQSTLIFLNDYFQAL